MINRKFKGMNLSEQQDNCLELFASMNYDETLGIEAGAGASKTFTMNAISTLIMPNRRGLYLAYNSVIVEEVKRAFPTYVDVTTTHGLAYSYIGKQYKDRLKHKLTIKSFIEHYKPTCLKGALTAQGYASAVMRTVSNYCLSQDSDINESHVHLIKRFGTQPDQVAYISHHVMRGAQALWADMVNVNSNVPTTHDAYLKLFVLRLEDKTIELPYEFCMLDEGQDTAPVAQQLIKLILNCKKAIVGDKWQSIYEWRGADNAMANFEFNHQANLTTCYRFGQNVADLANETLNTRLNANVNFVGNQTFESEIITDPSKSIADKGRMIITRTNSALFSELMTSLKNGNKPYLLKDAEQLHKIVEGVKALKSGHTPNCDELAVFSDWSELKEHTESDIGGDLAPLVKAVELHGTNNLSLAMEQVRKQDRNRATEILTTAHSSKGAEASFVKLGGDFDQFLSTSDPIQYQAESKLAYVALTRVIKKLDVSQCKALRKLVSPLVTYEKPTEKSTKRNPTLEALNAFLA
ncbi:UvrD-helicase domain-containing protein [Vibrio sp. R78045]|uniref:UvrD-helicase domain-containing protein n=1 Tax=Vibrio sp. R78045 TaxID=3093868 RepID=UPI0036F2D3A5